MIHWLRDLSFRYKVPLSLAAVILLTGAVFAGGMVWHAYQDLLENRTRNTQRLASVLAQELAPTLKHDEFWQAYQAIDLPPGPFTDRRGRDLRILVLRGPQEVYVSNRPERFEPGSSAKNLLGGLLSQVGLPSGPRVLHSPRGEGMIYVVRPIAASGGRHGTLVMGFSTASFWPSFLDIAQRIATLTGAVLLVLLPLGWWLGRRIARPLTYLSQCMDSVDPYSQDQPQCQIPTSHDEIGTLGRHFNELLHQLEEKAALESEVVRSERLAAIGRLTAGIAHEINNPLGGMRNAISNLRAQGPLPDHVEKTASLVDRGLNQIQQSVGALLVEVKGAEHPLYAADIEDLRTLILSNLQQKAVDLRWWNALPGRVEIPASLVRQVALNLLLNAIQAVHEGGRVEARFGLEEGGLVMAVTNSGPPIPEEIYDRLFEPFVHHGEGHGLGLWVTYQLVRQQGGTIHVSSEPGDTTFRVELSIEGTDAP